MSVTTRVVRDGEGHSVSALTLEYYCSKCRVSDCPHVVEERWDESNYMLEILREVLVFGRAWVRLPLFQAPLSSGKMEWFSGTIKVTLSILASRRARKEGVRFVSHPDEDDIKEQLEALLPDSMTSREPILSGLALFPGLIGVLGDRTTIDGTNVVVFDHFAPNPTGTSAGTSSGALVELGDVYFESGLRPWHLAMSAWTGLFASRYGKAVQCRTSRHGRRAPLNESDAVKRLLSGMCEECWQLFVSQKSIESDIPKL